MAPGVDEACAVAVTQGELSVVPEKFVEVSVHDMQKTRVDVREDVFFTPLLMVSREIQIERGRASLQLQRCANQPKMVCGDSDALRCCATNHR